MTAINFDARIFDTLHAIKNSTRLTKVQRDALLLRLENALYDCEHARNPYQQRVARGKTIKLCARLRVRAEDGYKR